jgi:signal transduction histidine kinase
MSARGRTLGAITFVSDERREYDAADLLLGEDLGRRCAMAVDNARLYAASQRAHQVAEAARVAATVIAQRTEELLGEANVARHEAEEADRAKTHFLGTISHEFRTPLTAMQGFTTLLSDEAGAPLTDTQRHQVERISAASDHLLTLIEEILGFAHQSAGHAELRLREVDLRDVVRDAGAMVESLAAAKGLQFRLRLPEEPIPFRTDPGKLRQIILNLVANAVKFTDAGEVRLDAESAAGSVLLRVTDTGIGIAPQHSEQVFAAFWQVDQSSSRVGGIGLGLAVTRQLAGLLGGEVTLESTPDSGSIFTVRLPLILPVPDTKDRDSSTDVVK